MYIHAAITSPALIYNAYLNSEEYARFTCITRNSDNIRWIIDGLTDIHYNVTIIRRIQSRLLLHQDRSFLSELLIPAIPVNKHIAVIKCKAFKTTGGFQVAESNETAQYYIQGLLDMVSNLTHSSYNTTHSLVEWLEPPTLNITNVEPDIESYTVCSWPKLNNSEPALECTNTSTPQVFLPKYYVDLLLMVTAWNIVGESNSSAQLVIENCGSTSAKVPLEGVYIIILHLIHIDAMPHCNIIICYTCTGDRFVVEIEFDKDNSTILDIFFTRNQVCSKYFNFTYVYACNTRSQNTTRHLLKGAGLSTKSPSVRH